MKKVELETSRFGTVTLGTLIDELEPHKSKYVKINFCGYTPTTLRSYRGFYDHLAVDFSYVHDDLPCGAFVNTLENAIGKTFVGYKGGDYRMGRCTPLWVESWGRFTNTAITGFMFDDDDNVILCTAHVET